MLQGESYVSTTILEKKKEVFIYIIGKKSEFKSLSASKKLKELIKSFYFHNSESKIRGQCEPEKKCDDTLSDFNCVPLFGKNVSAILNYHETGCHQGTVDILFLYYKRSVQFYIRV